MFNGAIEDDNHFIDGVRKFVSSKKSTHDILPQVLVFAGGAEGDRTPDLMTASHALSHLSYSPLKLALNNRNSSPVSI